MLRTALLLAIICIPSGAFAQNIVATDDSAIPQSPATTVEPAVPAETQIVAPYDISREFDGYYSQVPGTE